MLQHVGFETDHSFNFVSWSLSIEAICYLIFFYVSRIDKHFEICCLCLIIFGAYLLRDNLNIVMLNVPVGRGLFGFFTGCLLSRGITRGLQVPLTIAAVVLLCVIALQRYLPNMPTGIDAKYGDLALGFNIQMVMLPSFLIICLIQGPLRWLLATPILRKLGDLSFGIYMVHIFAQCVIIIIIKLIHADTPYGSFWFYLLYLCSIISLAELVNRFIERPGQRWLLRKYAR